MSLWSRPEIPECSTDVLTEDLAPILLLFIGPLALKPSVWRLQGGVKESTPIPRGGAKLPASNRLSTVSAQPAHLAELMPKPLFLFSSR